MLANTGSDSILKDFWINFNNAVGSGKPILTSFVYFDRIQNYKKEHPECSCIEGDYCLLEFEKPEGIPDWLTTEKDIINPIYQKVNLFIGGQPIASAVLVRFDRLVDGEEHSFFIPSLEDSEKEEYGHLCNFLNGQVLTFEKYYAGHTQLVQRL